MFPGVVEQLPGVGRMLTEVVSLEDTWLRIQVTALAFAAVVLAAGLLDFLVCRRIFNEKAS